MSQTILAGCDGQRGRGGADGRLPACGVDAVPLRLLGLAEDRISP